MNLSTRNINLGKEGVWEGNCSCNTFLILKLLCNYIHSTKRHIYFTSRLPLTPVVMSSVRPQSVRTTVIIGHPAYRFSDPRPHISRKISRFYLQTDWRVINLFLLSFISYRFLCKTNVHNRQTANAAQFCPTCLTAHVCCTQLVCVLCLYTSRGHCSPDSSTALSSLMHLSST